MTINYHGFELNEAQLQAIEKFVSLIAPFGGPITETGATTTAFNAAVPLDLPNGRDMGVHPMTADLLFSISPGATQLGFAMVELIMDGTHTIDINTHFQNPWQFDIPITAGQHVRLWFEYANSVGYVYGILGSQVDVLAPTLLSATVTDGANDKIRLHWSEPMNSALAALTAFTVTGKTVTAHDYIDSDETELTVTPSFTAGGAASVLNYVQPVGAKQRDLAGNNVQNFSGTAIANGVIEHIKPTLSMATVFNSTPTEIQLTWSEAINSAVSAPAAFAVSGHTVSAHTYVDATHTKLVVTAGFAYGETPRTVSYTKPVSNPIKDLAANEADTFSGFAIANNVAGFSAVDTFNRADGPIGTSSGGLVWEEFQGPALIDTNRATNQAGDAAFDVLNAGISSGTIHADITPIAQQPQIRFRVQDQNNFMGVVLFADLGFARVFKTVGGVGTNLDSGGSFTPNSVTPVGVDVIVSPTGDITVKLEGVTVITLNDNTFNTATKHGFFIADANFIDNFSVS